MHVDVLRIAGTMGPIPPMVGRAAECALLHEQLMAMKAGRGQLVIVGGEAGIGKTTVARHLAATAKALGCLVLAGHCYDLMAAAPYGLWLDLAAGYQRTADRAGWPALPPVLADRNLDGITNQAELFNQVRPFMQALAAVQPVVIVLEDAHWADPASLELLRHIAVHIDEAPILLLVTYRIDELTRQNPFYQQLPALTRESAGLRLDLKRLTRQDLSSLVAVHYALPEPAVGRLVAYLEEHSEGNPFFAIELLRTLEEQGEVGLTRSDSSSESKWTLAELDQVVVPALVRQVIDVRIARLGESMREPLAMAAVIGHDVPIDLWEGVAKLDENTLFTIIERALDAHLFTAAPDGTHIQFVHALTRAALYESILPPRRRQIHRTVAEALMGRSPGEADAIAYHLQQAGDRRAPEWLITAGERAQRAYAWLTARDRFQAAEALLAEIPGEAQTRARLLYRCGRLQRYSDAASGIANLRTATRLAEQAGDRVLAADATYSRGLLNCFADQWRIGLEEMTAGIEQMEALPLDVSRISWSTVNWMADALPLIDLASSIEIDPAADFLSAAGVNHRRGSFPWFYAVAGHLQEARSMAEAFRGHVAGVRDSGPLVLSASGHMYFGLGIALASLGLPDEARSAFARARAIYERLDHHAVIAFTLLTELNDVIVPYFATDRRLRQSVANEAQLALERAGGALPADLSSRRAQLTLMYLDGRWSDARATEYDDSNHGNYLMRRQITCALAPIAYSQGAADDVRNHVRALLPRGPETAPGDSVLLDGLMLQRLAANLALDEGDAGAARTWLEANDRWLAWSGAVLGRADNRLVWSRYEQAMGNHDHALALANEAVAAAREPRQPLTLLAALRHRGTQALTLGEIAEAEADLMEARAIADACDVPYERAETLLSLARLHALNGTSDAESLAAEARAIAARLGAKPLLGRIDALNLTAHAEVHSPDAVGLTHRELEVLRLVAQGLTDAEIGERLFISPRTASQHLRSIYAKLDLRSRAGATRFAMEHGLA